jgi:hypothetical protein
MRCSMYSVEAVKDDCMCHPLFPSSLLVSCVVLYCTTCVVLCCAVCCHLSVVLCRVVVWLYGQCYLKYPSQIEVAYTTRHPHTPLSSPLLTLLTCSSWISVLDPHYRAMLLGCQNQKSRVQWVRIKSPESSESESRVQSPQSMTCVAPFDHQGRVVIAAIRSYQSSIERLQYHWSL